MSLSLTQNSSTALGTWSLQLQQVVRDFCKCFQCVPPRARFLESSERLAPRHIGLERLDRRFPGLFLRRAGLTGMAPASRAGRRPLTAVQNCWCLPWSNTQRWRGPGNRPRSPQPCATVARSQLRSARHTLSLYWSSRDITPRLRQKKVVARRTPAHPSDLPISSGALPKISQAATLQLFYPPIVRSLANKIVLASNCTPRTNLSKSSLQGQRECWQNAHRSVSRAVLPSETRDQTMGCRRHGHLGSRAGGRPL